jgi:hypothetical protein
VGASRAAASRRTAAGTLDEAFDRIALARGLYFFPDLADTSDADEQAAIDAGRIRATRIDYAGRGK